MKNKDRIAELEDRMEMLEELILELLGDEDDDGVPFESEDEE